MQKNTRKRLRAFVFERMLKNSFNKLEKIMAQNAKKAQGKNLRKRDWGGIFYQESLPPNWQEYLDEQHIRYAASPWHDKDTADDGTVKKKHRHVIFRFEGVKSYQDVKEITDYLNQPPPQPIKSAIGNIRYFFHLDDPNKYQYEIADYIDHGVGVLKIIKMSGDQDEVFVNMALGLAECVRKFEFMNIDDVWFFMKENPNEYKDLLLFSTKHYGMTKHLCDANFNRKNAKLRA